MYRRVVLTGVTAAVILGAGGTALALTGSDSTNGSPSTASTAAAHHGKAKGRAKLLHNVAHAQIVRKGKNGFVTHTIVNGTVTAVSATSVTVQAADKKSETFVVNKDTKVRVRTKGKGAASSISKVAKGDHVVATGTGTSTITATFVVDVKK
jgi:hypothetical protein